MENLLTLSALSQEPNLYEKAYEKFCSGEISCQDFLKAMEMLEMISLSEYLTNQLTIHNKKI